MRGADKTIVGRIPPELMDFLKNGGRSLILRGSPGTGKTTLAMEILDKLGPEQGACFISGRIDEQALKGRMN